MRTIVMACIGGVLISGWFAWAGVDFEKLDVDKSGVIERDELPGPPARFDRLDADGDGLLSADEFRAPEAPGGAGRERMGRPRRISAFLSIFDADRDKIVTREELLSVFQAMDSNGDGSVDEEESDRYCRPRMLLARMDSDGDGTLSEDEAGEQAWRRLTRFDADGDGKLTVDELADVPPGPIAPAGGQRDPKRLLNRLDRDGDGVLSRDEWKGPPEGFDKIDSDGDGSVTVEELEAGLSEIRMQRPRRW